MQAKLSLVLPACDITGMSVHAVWRRLVGCILALYLSDNELTILHDVLSTDTNTISFFHA
jgi:hypothetical protein